MSATGDAVVAIERALELTAVRLREDPDYAVYRTARAELEAMRRTLVASGAPDRQLQQDLSIGWLAIRELEGSDPEYEQALKRAAYAYRQLPERPQPPT
jgi:hypothetical protein